MKLSTIICMKQWDKQGQEGSRCELSRNLCPGVILVGGSGVGLLLPGSMGALLTPSHPKIWRMETNRSKNGAGWL